MDGPLDQNVFTNIQINRPPYTRSLFDIYGAFNKPQKTPKERIKEVFKKYCTFSASSCLKKFLSFFPFIGILSNYKTSDFLSDLVSGLTVGIMHIPQGMAYGMLANVDPVYGLYTSFFPVLVYFLFGTSKHVSMGTFAVVSLMLGAAVDKGECDKFYDADFFNETVKLNSNGNKSNNGSGNGLEDAIKAEIDKCKLEIIVSVTFLAGLIQLGLALIQFGMVTKYLSSSLTRALTTGAAVHIFTSQIKHVFGIRTGRFINFKLYYTYMKFFERIGRTNVAAVVMSLICCVVLYCLQRWVSPKVKPYIKMPLPSEFILLIVGTAISYAFKFSSPQVFSMKVVGNIPQGIPPPHLPKFSGMSFLFMDAAVIALVSFIVSISMAKLFSNLQKYEVDSNQELIAYGITNIACAPLNCYVSTASLSRSYIQYSSGGKTQVAGLVSCSLLLVVILAVGPLFRELPNCVLAAIIIVNLKGIFLQVLDLRFLWKVAIPDALVWIITCLAVVVFDIAPGLLIGVSFAFLSIVLRTQNAKIRTLGNVQGTECYQDIAEFSNAKEVDRIKIVSFDSPLYFANASHFTEKLQLPKLCNLTVAQEEEFHCCPGKNVGNYDVSKHGADWCGVTPITDLIVDCSLVAFVDADGIAALNQIINDYRSLKVTVFLARCSNDVYAKLKKAMRMEKLAYVEIYVTVHDAVTAIMKDRSTRRDL